MSEKAFGSTTTHFSQDFSASDRQLLLTLQHPFVLFTLYLLQHYASQVDQNVTGKHPSGSLEGALGPRQALPPKREVPGSDHGAEDRLL